MKNFISSVHNFLHYNEICEAKFTFVHFYVVHNLISYIFSVKNALLLFFKHSCHRVSVLSFLLLLLLMLSLLHTITQIICGYWKSSLSFEMISLHDPIIYMLYNIMCFQPWQLWETCIHCLRFLHFFLYRSPSQVRSFFILLLMRILPLSLWAGRTKQRRWFVYRHQQLRPEGDQLERSSRLTYGLGGNTARNPSRDLHTLGATSLSYIFKRKYNNSLALSWKPYIYIGKC